MPFSALTAISPIDGRYANKTEALGEYFSEYALMKYRLMVECAWLKALANCQAIAEVPRLSDQAVAFLDELITNFDVNAAKAIKQFEQQTNHDVKACEYFLKQAISEHEELGVLKEFIHFALTSEDVNNLSYALMLRDAREQVMLPMMQQLLDSLNGLAQAQADLPLLARTHGQAASPTTVGKEFAIFVHRLQSIQQQFAASPIRGKCNGATGNFNAHLAAYPEIDWPSVSQGMITQLGLDYNSHTPQIEPHDYMAAYFNHLASFNTVLIDLCRDVWAYISLDYFGQKPVAGEVGSSTMPHKINPIDFENAEGNFHLSVCLMQFFARQLPISRWQRDLVDSTLQRNLGSALAYSLIGFQSLMKGLNKLSINADTILADLNAHPEVLTEAIQTVMRRYGIANPYEQLKALSRGQAIDMACLQDFITTLAIPDEAKSSLSQLSPSDYIGLAAQLAKSPIS